MQCSDKNLVRGEGYQTNFHRSFIHFSDFFRYHDDVIKWKHFLLYWPFVWGIHQSPVNSPHKGQWLGALMFSLICVWINSWVNNREAGDLRRRRAHYGVILMCQNTGYPTGMFVQIANFLSGYNERAFSNSHLRTQNDTLCLALTSELHVCAHIDLNDGYLCLILEIARDIFCKIQ